MAKVKNNAVFDEKKNANVPINSTLTSIMKGLLVNLSNAKVVIYFSSVMSLVLVNITETSQIFDRTSRDYRRNLFIFLHHFGAFFAFCCKTVL